MSLRARVAPQRALWKIALITFVSIGAALLALITCKKEESGYQGMDTAATWVDTMTVTTDTMMTDVMSTDTSATGMTSTDVDTTATPSKTVTSGASLPATSRRTVRRTSSLYFNGWIEPRNVPTPEPLERAELNQSYTFTADLGQWRANETFRGARSLEPGPELQREIDDTPPNRLVLNAYVRPILLGRGLKLLGGKLKVEIWRGGAWQPFDSTDEMVPFDIDLERMRSRLASDAVEFDPADLRFAGIRFGVKAEGTRGCAAVALSIWNEDRSIPLDNLIFPVTIGDAQCRSDSMEQVRNARGLTRLLFEDPDMTFDAALHVFEYELSDERAESVAVYVPSVPTADCTHFVWNPTRAISRVVSTAAFRQKLDDARKNNRYHEVAKTLKEHLLPEPVQSDVKCGSREALAHLTTLTENTPPRLFVRLVNVSNEPFFMPVGILFMTKDAGQPLFKHTPVIVQPLPRQTYELGDRCVSDLAFAIPATLHGPIATFTLAGSPLFQPIRRIGELEEFMRRSAEQPVALVLLAHHGDGFVYFDDPVRHWDVEFLNRRFGAGSVAMLSTCNAGDLRGMELRLVRGLNDAGVDAMILSSFDVKPPVGVALARHMTEGLLAARASDQPLRLDEVFAAARDKTIADLVPSVGEETARGYLSEFTLAGNGAIRICGKEM